MKKLNFIRLLSSMFLISMIVFSCTPSKKDFSYSKGGDIWFRGSGVELRFDQNMKVAIFYKGEKTPLNVSDNDTNAKPSHFIVVEGKEVTDFAVDYDHINVQPVEKEFGKGTKLTLKGVAGLKDGVRIEKTLSVEIYDNYPGALLTSASYKNLGTSDVIIDKTISNYLLMDASQGNPQKKPCDFWSFQGASIAWGLDYVIKIEDGFKQENWMGVQPGTKTGGGLPLIDIWNEKAGLAIAHINTKPQLVSLPVEVAASGKVNMSIQKELNITLAPGESYQTLKGVIVAHKLDYFEPLRTYSELMADQGVEQGKPSEEAYEAIWCGWGYLTDFTLDDIYGTLPKLKELGIKWVVIDDRWWDRYGDWNLRDFTFPGGEKQVKEFVDSLHHQGFKVKIWWAPTPVQPEVIPLWGGSVDPGMAKVAKDHPEWLIMDKDGNYPRDCRDMYQFCPSVPEVQEYMKKLTTRFIGDWGFDGHKLDAYYVVPPCYNPKHNHKHPEESYQDLPKLLKVIYETSKSIKSYSVTEICNCGTTQDFYQSVYTDQPVISDPTSVEQARRRVKSMKALWGSNAPVYTDHVEHIRLEVDMNDKSDTAKVGQDFATSMGTGGVIGTKFTWPKGPQNMQLTGEREKHWQKWFKLYNEKMLSKGNYLNLYDIVYDKPESHVIQKGQNYYYAFYADHWQGPIELRGLENRKYKVYDYVNNVDMGTVTGSIGTIKPTFNHYLLVECIPVK
ncbi:MAG: alpha-galactosidase [Draconibacterium sp.]|nr:alpha-galactosidase [Draconibacterium sp.]